MGVLLRLFALLGRLDVELERKRALSGETRVIIKTGGVNPSHCSPGHNWASGIPPANLI